MGMAKQGTIDKMHLLHALQKIHQGMMAQADGVKDLLSIVEGTDACELPALLVTGVASDSHSRAAEGMKDSEEVMAT